jgi:hypothetical protein
VPTPFIVVYDELVNDCKEVERRMHKRFEGYRVKDDREFFRVRVKNAVRALHEEAANFLIKESEFTNRVEILDLLRAKFGDDLQPDLVSVSIIQFPEVCLLESVRRTSVERQDEIVERVDLSITGSGDDAAFPLNMDVKINARNFVEKSDLVDLLMITPLLSEAGIEKAIAEYNRRVGPVAVDPFRFDLSASIGSLQSTTPALPAPRLKGRRGKK